MKGGDISWPPQEMAKARHHPLVVRVRAGDNKNHRVCQTDYPEDLPKRDVSNTMILITAMHTNSPRDHQTRVSAGFDARTASRKP